MSPACPTSPCPGQEETEAERARGTHRALAPTSAHPSRAQRVALHPALKQPPPALLSQGCHPSGHSSTRKPHPPRIPDSPQWWGGSQAWFVEEGWEMEGWGVGG